MKRGPYGSSSITVQDIRQREQMERSNAAFVEALRRYFTARELWGPGYGG